MNFSCESANSNRTINQFGEHKIWEVVLIILITAPLSLVTIIGNLLVMLSFWVNSHLRTVSNYFLLSLAVADLVLGAISMNLYTIYIILGRWTLGDLACDIWLTIDYVVSNASVMNLLLISFDRFFSITRPLTYRAKRTPRRAAVMITLAWVISFILWGPAILLWPYMAENRTEEKAKCSIQFLTKPVFTFGTAIAAFYLPVSIMIILYWRIYRETAHRTRDLAGLLGLVDGGCGVSLDSRLQTPYSISAKSSISSNKGLPYVENHNRKKKHSWFSIRLCKRKVLTSSNKKGNSSSSWTMVEEEASDSTSSEVRGMTSTVAHLPMIQWRDGQGEVSGHEHQEIPNLQSYGYSERPRQPQTKKGQSMMGKENKAARTLSAILLAFIITWTPYNIMVLVSIFKCIPEKLWQLGYWLCYVNSTVNPLCYSLCNKSFRVTFKMLLLSRWDQRKWDKPRHRSTFRPHSSSSTI